MFTENSSNKNQDQVGEVNSLIIKWLTEWRDQAKRHNSKMEFVYGKALKSLREHPIPLRSGQECKKLKNFGNVICAQIDKKFSEHFNVPLNNSVPSTSSVITDHFSVAVRKRSNISPQLSDKQKSRPKKLTRTIKPNSNRHYIPQKDSSPFALLIALLRYELEFSNSRVNKFDLQQMAKLYIKKNNTLTWTSAITSLIGRQLIARTEERNERYFLTEDGKKLAKSLALGSSNLQDFVTRFLQHDDNQPSATQFNEFDKQQQTHASQQTCQKFILQAGSYEIILCLDARERYSDSQGNQSRTAFATALQDKGIKYEIRTLPLGDFLWIAREKIQSNSYFTEINIRRELVLDFIIERKRIDDLAQSIKDNRWNEQQFRLRNCGLRRPSYLIEYFGKPSRKQDHNGLPASTLDQAIFNCEIDGFEIRKTENFEETIRYLANMSRWLERFYANKSIISCQSKEELEKISAQELHYMTFNEFSTNSTKIQTFTVREMFIKHLLQIKGLSKGKINMILEKYPTIRCLMKTYSLLSNDTKTKNNLLADIKCDSLIGSNRRLGPTISKKICQFYTSVY